MTRDEESRAVCAIRYCIGRQSYIVGDGQRWAREFGARSKHVRSIIRRDLQETVERLDLARAHDPACAVPMLGDAHDERGWRAVLADLDALTAQEGNTL
jgi:hypothetical protein